MTALLTLDRYVVQFTRPDDPEVRVVEVTIRNGDRLRAELEAGKLGLRDIKANPFHFTTLWVWSALMRAGELPADTPARRFTQDLCDAIEPLDDEAVPPTQPAADTGSPSSSPASGPARSTAGSTPTSTSGF